MAGFFSGQARGEVSGRLQGSIPRPVWNSYAAPLQDSRRGGGSSDLEQAHFELGTRFELGVVYTMIAGLLNILALYDALEGPAYEDDEEQDKERGERGTKGQ